MPDPLPLAAAQARRGRPGRPRVHPRPVLEPGHAVGTPVPRPRTSSGDPVSAQPTEGSALQRTERKRTRKAPPLPPRLLSVRSAAHYLGISVAATWNLVAQGHLRRVQLPGIGDRDLRLTLVDLHDLDQLVERGKA